MGMDVGTKKGGLNSDINVTPLCDVMLVLLIIVMLIAPMLQRGVDVRLPEAANTAEKPETQGQTQVAITADRRYYVDQVQVLERDLLTRVQNALERKKERLVVIKGDEDAPYSAIMAVLDELRRANIEDVGLITERRLRRGAAGGE